MPKGSAYEREVGKELSLWLTLGGDRTQLVRSIQSGGWSERTERQTGDLAANGPRGRKFREVFVVECKNREDFEWRHIWSSKEPGLWEWWKQVLKDAEDAKCIPILAWNKNYQRNLIGLPPDFAHTLFPEARKVTIFWGDLDTPPVTLLEFDYLKTIDPDYFIQRGQEYLSS